MRWAQRQNRIGSLILIALAATFSAGLLVVYQGLPSIRQNDADGVRVWDIVSYVVIAMTGLIAILAGLFYLLLGLHLVFETRKFLGSNLRPYRRLMQKLASISEHGKERAASHFLLNAVAATSLFAAFLFEEYQVLSIMGFAVFQLIWLRLRSSTLPIAIFLSTSSVDSNRIHLRIKRVISPLRVVALLDIPDTRAPGPSDELRLDSLRTGNDDDWWTVIQLMLETVPLIVVDADARTSGVDREISYIASANLLHKTIFVTAEPARIAERHDKLAGHMEHCFAIEWLSLQPVLTRLLDFGSRPSPASPIRNQFL